MAVRTRAVAVVVALTALTVGAPACLGGSSATSPAQVSGHSVLRVAFGPDDGSPGLVVYRLTCGPAAGTVPNPAAACAWLTRHPRLVFPRPSNEICSPTVGAWAVGITAQVGGRRVDTHFDACAEPQVAEWMRLSGYRPCPATFMQFNCHHGPYAFGKAHMRGQYPTVPRVVGMTLRRAEDTLTQRGLVPVFSYQSHARGRRGVVTAQSPSAGGSVSVYTSVFLTVVRRHSP
jgi:PASTA domain